MKRKVLFSAVLLLTVSMTLGYFYLNNNSINKENTITELRKKHKDFLENSPFKETLKLSKTERRALGLPPNKYSERMWELTMDPSTGKPHPERLFALQESIYANKVPGDASTAWEERGPNNVGGRTRAIMYDPNDSSNKRVFAGGVSGGLWVMDDITNSSSTWTEVNIPQNLAISALAYDPNDKQIFYAGTGESYVAGAVNGNGLWQSKDGGVNWSKIFGGITGETTFQTSTKLTVNSPANIAGDYFVTRSTTFGPAPSLMTGDLALVDDSTDNTDDGCETITNAAEINGKIAVIIRGDCSFTIKVKNAQDAGAIAVLIVNNVYGIPIGMSGEDATITIPVVMISKDDGQPIIDELGGGVNVSITPVNPAFENTFVTPGIQHINDIKIRDVSGTSEVYVAVGETFYSDSSPQSLLGAEEFGLYKSTDEGSSWSQITLPDTPNSNRYIPNDIEVSSDNTIWISTEGNIFSNVDGGGTILSSTDGTNFTVKHTITDGKRTQISVSGSNAETIYVIAELSDDDNPVGLYYTTDSFVTTNSMSLPSDADTGIPTNDFTRGQAGYDLLIEVDPNDDTILYAGGIDLFRSTDTGSNWSQISKWSNNNNLAALNVSYVHADQHILVFNPSDSNQGVFGCDGGVFYGSDLSSASASTNAISARNTNYNTVQFYKGAIGSEESAEKLLAGAQDNGSHLINNASAGINGSSRIRSGDGAYVFIDKDNEYMISSYVYNVYEYHNYSSGNHAYSIVYNTSDGDFINPAALDSENNILYASGDAKVYRYTLDLFSATTSSMTDVLLTNNPSAFKTSTFTSTTLFVGTDAGELYKVTDADSGSGTWVDITGVDFYGSISCIELGETEDDILVTFYNYGIKNVYYSQDGGSSWSSKEGNFPDIPVRAILMNKLDSDEVILGTDLGVWGTENFNDSDPTWFQAQNGMKDAIVTSFDLRSSDNTVLASTYGRGMFTGSFLSTDPTFTIVAQNSSVEVEKPAYAIFTFDFTTINGYNSITRFSVTNLPTGATSLFNPTLLNLTDTFTLTIGTASITAGDYTITVTGTEDGGSEEISTNVSLKVTMPDDDGDGVENADDNCPNTPTGESVDSNGCSDSQLDDDNDGVMNDEDTCPNTPNGESVDSNGCSDSQLDDDNDGVMNSNDQCPNTIAVSDQKYINSIGCFTLPDDHFSIQTIGETCVDENNGQIIITTQDATFSYSTTINNVDYSFTNGVTTADLLPGPYEFCISVDGRDYERCYNVIIEEGEEISGKTSVNSNKVNVNISKGTAPFNVYINEKSVFETSSNSFEIDVKHGDLLEVKTAISCEGTMAKTIDLFENILVYPNPTKGNFDIAFPISEEEIKVEIYNAQLRLISSQKYSLESGNVQINIENQPSGLYFIKIYTDKPKLIKVLKD